MRSQHWHGLGKVEKDIFGKLVCHLHVYVSGFFDVCVVGGDWIVSSRQKRKTFEEMKIL